MSVKSLSNIPPFAPLKDKLEVSVSKHVSTPREAHGTPPVSVEAKKFVEDLATMMTVVLLSNVSYDEILNFSRLVVEALSLRTGALLSVPDPGQPNNNKQLDPALQSVFTFADDLWTEAPVVMKAVDLPLCKAQLERRQFAYAMRDTFLRLVDGSEALGNQLSQNLGNAARTMYGSLSSILDNNKGLDRDLQPLKDYVVGPSEKGAETKKSNDKSREEGFNEGVEVGRAQALSELDRTAKTPAKDPTLSVEDDTNKTGRRK